MSEENSDNLPLEKGITCLACFAPNSATATVCQSCHEPLTENATLSPMGVIKSEGRMWRKAVEVKRPKFIVVLGTWVIFAPLFLVSLPIMINAVLMISGTEGFFLFWVGFLLSLASGIILFRVTKNYLTISKKK